MKDRTKMSQVMIKYFSLVFNLSPSRDRNKLGTGAQMQITREGDGKPEPLFRELRTRLANKSHYFRTNLTFEEERRRIELEWFGAGHMVGVACWNNSDHTAAVNILMYGLESAEDLKRLISVLAHNGFTLPAAVGDLINAEERRPLMATLYYNAGSTNPLVPA